ncbi:hypothetical protein [uncultured Tateyamaria sp.]|uniref:hypothetical protein n=1 Tax=uncultured Tateyamaria sp. TaxID=455651 RepID=UPI00260853EF|nr:hypothetical protein [uncultured Tateyamaria sp.]
MELALTENALKEGVLRVWLRRIPDEGGIVHAYAVNNPNISTPVASATLYGRGSGSTASERTMLVFRLNMDELAGLISVGDALEIRLEGDENGAFKFDVLEIE